MMAVNGGTRHDVVRVTLDGSLALGGLLVLMVLTLLAIPCNRGLCDRPQSAAGAAAHGVLPDDGAHDPTGDPAHCALHCGLMLLAPLLLVSAPALTVQFSSTASRLRLRLALPPPSPPPQLA